ncbi:InlB B-repeat-containing protein [Galactobacillus timonensis]|uniref:InlB B-repeat-containing protein n=1 Tax=Galactobacillus timonensis TaxID=2041840 RepID=UPI0014369750|nr:InlB B-repeat-containing protein [Galactobacillus timonensis]
MSRNNHSHHFDHSLFIMRILLCGVLALTYAPVSVHAEDGDTVSDTETVTQPDDGSQDTGDEQSTEPDKDSEAVPTVDASEDTPAPQPTITPAPESTAAATTAPQPEVTAEAESTAASQMTAAPSETPAPAPSAEAVEPTMETDPMPSIDASVTADNGVTAIIHADEGTFPAGTTVTVTTVSEEEAAAAAADLLGKDVIDAAAVDITFHDGSGNEVEPADGRNVQVTLQTAAYVAGDNYEVVHIKEDGSAEAVNSVQQVTDSSAQFSADSFSIYAIVGTDDIPFETYEFYDGETLISSQTVKKGDTLLEPEAPSHGDTAAFLGWADVSGNLFHDFGTIDNVSQNDAVIRLHAQFQDSIYLYYYDQYDNLIESQAVAPDSTVKIEPDAPLIQVQPLTQCQDGWSTEKNGTKGVSGEYHVGKTSVNLYPILKEGYWISFETNSDSSIARQFIAKNATNENRKAAKPDPDPVKEGYVFDQWYTDQDLTTPYDFHADVTQPMTLYAGYKPATDTEYTVRYWLEYQKEPGGGVGDGTWDYKMIAQEVLKGTTGAKAQFDEQLIYHEPYGEPVDGYELNTERTPKDSNDPARPAIAADGSTIFNVYYRCKTYNLSITVPKADGTKESLQYDQVKYSSDLTNFWKAVFAIRPEDELFDGTHRFVFPYKSGSEFVEVPSNLLLMPSMNVSMTQQVYGGDNSFYELYLETLHGKAPAGKEAVTNTSIRKDGDTRTYYLKSVDQFSSGTYGGFDATTTDYPGFSPNIAYSDGHYHTFGAGNAQIWFRYPEDWFHSTNGEGNYHVARNSDGSQHMYNGKDDPIRVYYKRNSYPLNFHTDGGPDAASQSVLYEDDLHQYQPASYVKGTTKKKEGNEEFVFAGWYVDQQLTKPFDFNTTMPHNEIDLYAKWVPESYTVTFDTGEGTAVEPDTNVEYGHSISKPADPSCVGYVFLGWTFNGKPFNFASGITADTTLKAEWRSIDAWQVRYDLNGGTAGHEITDDTWYYEDAGIPVASASGIKAPAGKVFIGWKSSGDGKIYYPNATAPMKHSDVMSVDALTATFTRSSFGMTLTAQWGDIQKTTQLTYDFNFGRFGVKTSGSVDSSVTVSQLPENSQITLAGIGVLMDLSKVPSNWMFTGWYKDAACTDGPYTEVLVDSADPSANRLYAGWRQNDSGSSGSSTSSTASSKPVAAKRMFFPLTSASPRFVPKTGVEGPDESGN